MKVKELINILKKVEQNKEIVFYHLKNNDLQSCEYESFLDVDDDFVGKILAANQLALNTGLNESQEVEVVEEAQTEEQRSGERLLTQTS